MKYVFILGSEHQTFQLDYAIKHFCIFSKDIIILIQKLNINYSLEEKVKMKYPYVEIISYLNWTFIDIFKHPTLHRSFINICHEIKHKYNELIFLPCHYSDDATLLFLSIVKPNKFYLLDEGTASFSVIHLRRHFNALLKIKLCFKSYLYCYQLKEPIIVTYFTKFKLKTNLIDRVENFNIPKIDNSIVLNYNQIGFLGSSVVELNLMKENVYIYYLNEIILRNPNSTFFYFKHRKESFSKLKKVEELGFEIINYDGAFESYFASQEKLPHRLASFFTTSVLINVLDNFRNVPNLDIYSFPIAKLNKEKNVHIDIIRMLRGVSEFNFIDLK